MVMGNYKILRGFNFVILLKSWKFDAREIYILQYDLNTDWCGGTIGRAM